MSYLVQKRLFLGLSCVVICWLFSSRLDADDISPTLKEGTSGSSVEIKILQKLLNEKVSPSPGLVVDGSFGPATKSAVIEFQQKNGLSADGIVGTGTWKKLFRVTLNSNVKISVGGVAILRNMLDSAGLETATITSGVRSAADQARIMYENIKEHGVEHQKALYGENGDKVIDVYADNSSKPKDEVIALMKDKIVEIGPSKVSKHCSDSHDVFDVDPSTIADKVKFEKVLKEAKEAGEISDYILPPTDPAYHIEREK
jgi:hypothetical protein